MQKIRISPQFCTIAKFARSGCRQCLLACPVHAIEPGDRSLIITSRCTGCECCVAACPNEAFSLATEGEDSSQPDRDQGSIYCSKLVSGKIDLSKPLTHGIVPCIGSLPLHSLLNRGTQAREPIKIITAECDHCEMRAGYLTFEKARREILSPLVSLKVPVAPIIVQKGTDRDKREAGKRYLACRAHQEDKSALGRRDFILSLRRAASPLGRDKKPKGIEKEGPESGEKRLPMWISALIALFRNNREIFAEEEKAPFFSEMEIDDSCTGCEVCASFCPTGALRGKSAQEKFHLEWTPSHCSGCDLCEEICPEHAIHFSPGLPVQKIYEETSSIVKSLYEYHCPECRREYRSRASQVPCPYCQKQAELIQDYSRALYGKTGKTSFKNE